MPHLAHDSDHTRSQESDTLQKARYRLAALIIVLFGITCFGAVLFPNVATFERLVPFIAAPLMLVLNYYFGRRERE